MVEETNGGSGKRALATITKDTLLPLGLVIGLVAGGIWIGQKVERFGQLESDVARQDTRIWLVEESLATWRREVETAIGQRLSDPKPKPATHGGDEHDGSTQVQDHQVRTAGGGGGGDRRVAGGGVGGPPDGRSGGRPDRSVGLGGGEDHGGDAEPADRLSPTALSILSGAPPIRPGR